MSGGGLTEYGTGLYVLTEWADRVRPQNPMLAEMMQDLYVLLHSYDYYLAGDYGEEAVEKAWKKFADKWLSKDMDKLRPIIMERCIEIINSVLTGHTKER